MLIFFPILPASPVAVPSRPTGVPCSFDGHTLHRALPWRIRKITVFFGRHYARMWRWGDRKTTDARSAVAITQPVGKSYQTEDTTGVNEVRFWLCRCSYPLRQENQQDDCHQINHQHKQRHAENKGGWATSAVLIEDISIADQQRE